jgi:hypothetical protein
MPANTIFSTLTTPPIRLANGTLDTRPDYRGGVAPGGFVGANTPLLRFSDITSGPTSGLGDGLGAGSLVTIWGQNLGETRGTSSVFFTDSLGVKREAAHYYYWKRADGVAPSGPSNLWKSHRMIEIAFSIPAGSMTGVGQITVEVGGTVSSSVPFTIRAGRILWVAPEGNNSNAGTDYNAPKAFVNGSINPSAPSSFGNALMQPGDIVYSRSVNEPVFTSGARESGMYLRSLVGTEAEPIAIVAYPGAYSTVVAKNTGFHPFLTSGIITSKYSIKVGKRDPASTTVDPGNSAESNFHIGCTDYGRAVGNYCGERSGWVFDGWSGAITGKGESFKVFGNHLFDLGNDYTSHFQHTTYFSIRNDTATVAAPWEVSFNFLEDNKAKFGLHFYDESQSGASCGVLTGTIKVHNNVVVNQKGSGINLATRVSTGVDEACWSANIEIIGNLLINVGLGPVAETNNGTSPLGISVGGDIESTTCVIDSNTIYGFSRADSRITATPYGISLAYGRVNPNVTVTNNALFNDFDAAWLNLAGLTTLNTASHNALQNTAGNVNAVTPSGFSNTVTGDLLQTVTGFQVSLLENSPLVNAGANKLQPINLYGVTSNNIGAI